MIQTIKTVKSKCDTDTSWTANFVWFNGPRKTMRKQNKMKQTLEKVKTEKQTERKRLSIPIHVHLHVRHFCLVTVTCNIRDKTLLLHVSHRNFTQDQNSSIILFQALMNPQKYIWKECVKKSFVKHYLEGRICFDRHSNVHPCIWLHAGLRCPVRVCEGALYHLPDPQCAAPIQVVPEWKAVAKRGRRKRWAVEQSLISARHGVRMVGENEVTCINKILTTYQTLEMTSKINLQPNKKVAKFL